MIALWAPTYRHTCMRIIRILMCLVVVWYWYCFIIMMTSSSGNIFRPRYWSFVREIHRSPVNSPRKSQRRGALVFSLICAWTNGWVNNQDGSDSRYHHAHYDVTVMWASTLDKPFTHFRLFLTPQVLWTPFICSSNYLYPIISMYPRIYTVQFYPISFRVISLTLGQSYRANEVNWTDMSK